MFKYGCLVGNGRVAVALDTEDPNAMVPIQYDGDGSGLLRDWLTDQYGAFGHMIGEAATPIDLHAAMSRQSAEQWRPVLIEGRDIVTTYDPDLPDGAVT